MKCGPQPQPVSPPGTLFSLSLEVTPDRGPICPIHICSMSKGRNGGDEGDDGGGVCVCQHVFECVM